MMSTSGPALLNVGKGGSSRRLFCDRNKRRRAVSTNSDMVHPRRAASCLRSVMIESSMFSVVFICFTIPNRCIYVNNCHTSFSEILNLPRNGEGECPPILWDLTIKNKEWWFGVMEWKIIADCGLRNSDCGLRNVSIKRIPVSYFSVLLFRVPRSELCLLLATDSYCLRLTAHRLLVSLINND